MAATTIGTSGVTFPDATSQSTAAVGLGATWTDVSGSRALGTTYTNSTGKYIQVSVSALNVSTAGDKALGFYVNGNQVGVNGSFSTAGTPYPSTFIVVPPGATYSAASVGTVGVTLNSWWELR